MTARELALTDCGKTREGVDRGRISVLAAIMATIDSGEPEPELSTARECCPNASVQRISSTVTTWQRSVFAAAACCLARSGRQLPITRSANSSNKTLSTIPVSIRQLCKCGYRIPTSMPAGAQAVADRRDWDGGAREEPPPSHASYSPRSWTAGAAALLSTASTRPSSAQSGGSTSTSDSIGVPGWALNAHFRRIRIGHSKRPWQQTQPPKMDEIEYADSVCGPRQANRRVNPVAAKRSPAVD